MKPILEYLKRRRKQTYSLTDYSADSVIRFLEQNGYECIERVPGKTLCTTLEQGGDKTFIVDHFTKHGPVGTITAYNLKGDKDKRFLGIWYDSTGCLSDCQLGMKEGIFLKWLDSSGRPDVKNIDLFLEQ